MGWNRIAAVGLALVTMNAAAADKPVIRSQSDLPDARFPFAAPPSAMMMTPAYLAMLPALRHEAERLLSTYDIQDPTIRGDLLIDLASVAVLEGREADAERYLADYRAMQGKPQLRAVGGLATAIATAQLGTPPAARCAAAAGRLTRTLAPTNPLVVRDQIVSAYGQIQVSSASFFAGLATSLLDPVAKQRGSLDVLQALTPARFRVAAEFIAPCRAALTTAARVWLDAPANRAVDIWPAREPAPVALAHARPVVVAVWDSGYDPTLFPGQLATDPADPVDGRDNDGNGVVDDWNGPTWDAALRPRNGAIMPPTNRLRARLAAQNALDKGQLDLRFGFDTPEATLAGERARNASAAEQGDDRLAGTENSGRAHGTACASEIADGAPYVRLFNVAALPWGTGEDGLDLPYDEATIARWAAAIERIGPRLRGAHVRVVSMSWTLTADEISAQLLDHGLERDPARAKARGITMQATIREALRRLFAGTPNTLFVIAAGNTDQPDDVVADATQGLNAPNVMHIGATGTNGRPTSFTVFGHSVDIYAQGEAVPLRWPGDIALHESGTSMATPLVARAAAQMLAMRPSLTGAQVRAGLIASATIGESGQRLLHPAAAVAWAGAQMTPLKAAP